MKHYKFETSGESDLEKDGNLLTLKANIQPWEFVQFLSTGTIQEDIQPGKVMKGLMLSRVNSQETPSIVFLNSPPYCYLLVKGSYISCSRRLGRGRYILLYTCHLSVFHFQGLWKILFAYPARGISPATTCTGKNGVWNSISHHFYHKCSFTWRVLRTGVTPHHSKHI